MGSLEPGSARDGHEYWLQRLISFGLHIGISKHELLHDYTMRELMIVFREYNALMKEAGEEKTESVSAENF